MFETWEELEESIKVINQIILEEKGLKKENIIDSKICSVCNSNLVHSYRVEKEEYGLETAIIELK